MCMDHKLAEQKQSENSEEVHLHEQLRMSCRCAWNLKEVLSSHLHFGTVAVHCDMRVTCTEHFEQLYSLHVLEHRILGI